MGGYGDSAFICIVISSCVLFVVAIQTYPAAIVNAHSTRPHDVVIRCCSTRAMSGGVAIIRVVKSNLAQAVPLWAIADVMDW